jgi:hypothetical protein
MITSNDRKQEIFPKYRLYIDETGDHGFGSLINIEHRYLGLAGCIFERKINYNKAVEEMNTLKRKYWPDADPDEPVIFHRNHMIRQQGYFGIFKDINKRTEFDEELLSYLNEQKYTLIMVVIDKKGQIDKYTTPYHPYHFSLMVMLERYCGFLEFFGEVGDVIAESRGGTEDRKLKDEFREIYEKGTRYHPASFFQSFLTSHDIKIKPKSNNVVGLQISDMIAYPIREKMFYERKIRINNFSGTFNEKIYNVVKDKLNRNFYSGKISGYGEIFRDFK